MAISYNKLWKLLIEGYGVLLRDHNPGNRNAVKGEGIPRSQSAHGFRPGSACRALKQTQGSDVRAGIIGLIPQKHKDKQGKFQQQRTAVAVTRAGREINLIEIFRFLTQQVPEAGEMVPVAV